MRRSIRYNPGRREIQITVPRGYEFPHELLGVLRREGLLSGIPGIEPSGRRKKTLKITLAQHNGLPSNNLLERLADWISKTPGHRVVHDPWEVGGKPVNIDLAVELIVDAILDFDEAKLATLPI